MKSYSHMLLLLTILCAGFAQAAEAPEDFAFGLPIEIQEDGAVFEVPLPLDFYRGLSRGDQSDMAVFNGRGEVVPSAIKQDAQATAAPSSMAIVPFFPILAEPGRDPDRISLNVQRDSTGAVIHLETLDEGTADLKNTVAYLIDLASIKKPIKALVLDWDAPEDGFIERIKVEAGNDLENWSSLESTGAIASLGYNEHRLVQRKISFAPTDKKYLRIKWPTALQKVKLKRAEAETMEGMVEAHRNWSPVRVSMKQEQPGEYTFDSPGPLPVDRIRVQLPQRNSLISASLLSRENEKAAWKHRDSGLLYKLRFSDENLVRTDFAIPPTTDRHWMLRIQQNGGGLGQGLPEIEIGWVPQRLLFLARGEGPFMLAYGNARYSHAAVKPDDLLSRFAAHQKGGILTQPAAFGPQVILGGESRLKPSSSIGLRKLALWVVLLLSVVLLAYMSLRVYKEMKNQDAGNS